MLFKKRFAVVAAFSNRWMNIPTRSKHKSRNCVAKPKSVHFTGSDAFIVCKHTKNGVHWSEKLLGGIKMVPQVVLCVRARG